MWGKFDKLDDEYKLLIGVFLFTTSLTLSFRFQNDIFILLLAFVIGGRMYYKLKQEDK
jgi:hypothetical protein